MIFFGASIDDEPTFFEADDVLQTIRIAAGSA
jgi:hypothetical protein